jgi:hypothetical protein
MKYPDRRFTPTPYAKRVSAHAGQSAEEAHAMATRERPHSPLPWLDAKTQAPRQYRFAELETGATLAALNDALEWRGIEASDIVAVRCRPPPAAYGHRPAHYRVIYAR